MRLVFAKEVGGNQALRPPWWLLALLACLIMGYVLVAASGSAASVNVANLVGPSVLALGAAWAGQQLIRRAPESVWTPYAWFLLAIIAFYAVGPLLYPLGDAATLQRVSRLYRVTPDQLLRTNLLNAAGILSVLIGVLVVQELPVRPRLRWPRGGYGKISSGGPAQGATEGRERMPRSRISPKLVALSFVLVGGVLQYLIILPSRFGMTDTVLPGMIWNLGRLHLLGIAVLAYVVARGSRSWRLPLAVLWALQFAVSVLLFSKLEMILSLLLPALGGYLGHRRLKRLVAWGLLAAAVYLTVPQFVLYGRSQIYRETGNISRAGLQERAAIVSEWFARGMPSLEEAASPISTGWSRLNYAPVQAFAMERYDDGYPGQRLRHLGVVLIPRVLWPDKPATTDMGEDFYQRMTGRRGSQLGLGVFGGGYWNYGWAGVVGFGLATGIVFAMVSGLSIRWIRRRSLAYLPSIALGIQMGAVGTTGTLVNSVVGGGALLLFYAAATWAIISLIHRSRRQGRGRLGRFVKFGSPWIG